MKYKDNEAKRNIGLDILKLIAMISVTTMHFWGWGGVRDFSFTDIRFLIGTSLYELLSGGTNWFFMITAWYATDIFDAHKIKNKLSSLHWKILVYSVGITLLIQASGILFEINEWLKMVFPICGNAYWFMTEYFIFIICLPFIKKLVTSINNQEAVFLLGAVIAYEVLTGNTVVPRSFIIAFSVILLKNQKVELKVKRWHMLLFYPVAMLLGACLDFTTIRFQALDISQIRKAQEFLYLAGGTFLFLALVQIKFFHGKKCNLISVASKHTLATYLISVHPIFGEILYGHIRERMPENLLGFLLYFVLCTLGLTCICILIDFVVTQVVKALRIKGIQSQ